MTELGGRSLRARVGLRTVALSLFWGTASWAAQNAPAASAGYAIEYGSSACGWGDDFEGSVQSKRRRAIEGTPVSVRVSIEQASEDLLASMVLEREGSPARTREFHAGDCDEALSALTTVVAIALDAAVDESVGEAVPPPVEPEPAIAAPAPVPPVEPSPPWVPGVGAVLLLDFSMAPQAVFGGSLLGTLRRGESGLGVRVHAGYRFNEAARTAGREFGVSWLGGGVELCPHSFDSGVFSFEPCAGFELGRYRVEGNSGFSRSTPRSLLWSAGSVVARGRVRLGRGWSWEGAAHLLFPVANQLSLVADTQEMPGQIPLFDVDPVSVAVSTGINVDFP